jgi:hypothetical protein
MWMVGGKKGFGLTGGRFVGEGETRWMVGWEGGSWAKGWMGKWEAMLLRSHPRSR